MEHNSTAVIKGALCWMPWENNQAERSGMYEEIRFKLQLKMRREQPGQGLGGELAKQV